MNPKVLLCRTVPGTVHFRPSALSGGEYSWNSYRGKDRESESLVHLAKAPQMGANTADLKPSDLWSMHGYRTGDPGLHHESSVDASPR